MVGVVGDLGGPVRLQRCVCRQASHSKEEPIPCPDILVTDVICNTKKIRVGTAGFVLPFHNQAQIANRVANSEALAPWLKPDQQPRPPISVAGATPGSFTPEFAGEENIVPMSIFLSQADRDVLGELRERPRQGRHSRRSLWSITREMIIADTDEEGWNIARDACSAIARLFLCREPESL